MNDPQHELAALKQELEAKRAECQSAYTELSACRRDAALVIHALDRSCQLIEAYLAWLPEGQVMSPGLETAKEAWTRAMRAIHR